MSDEPIDLAVALAGFDQLWSPRIVTRVNDYDVRIAKVAGEHVWHVHDHTDEFFLVLDGELRIALRDGDGDGDGERNDLVAGAHGHLLCDWTCPHRGGRRGKRSRALRKGCAKRFPARKKIDDVLPSPWR
jgi:hypothetical protein